MNTKDELADKFDESDNFVRPWMVVFLPSAGPRRDFVMWVLLFALSSAICFVFINIFEMTRLAPKLFAIGGGMATWRYYQRMTQRRNHNRKNLPNDATD